MTELRLDDLQPGLVLAHPAVDARGNVLLNEGVALTERHLTLLRAPGVTHVDATPSGMESTAANTALSAQEASMYIEQHFRNTDPDHPLISELKRICLRRLQGTGGAS